jgi:hypothetical protein
MTSIFLGLPRFTKIEPKTWHQLDKMKWMGENTSLHQGGPKSTKEIFRSRGFWGRIWEGGERGTRPGFFLVGVWGVSGRWRGWGWPTWLNIFQRVAALREELNFKRVAHLRRELRSRIASPVSPRWHMFNAIASGTTMKRVAPQIKALLKREIKSC